MADSNKENPPKKVVVGGMTFNINYPESVPGTHDVDFGNVDMTNLEINIYKSAPAMQRETLMHEVLHILCKLTNIERLVTSEKHEEQIVSGLSNMMWQMIRDNPSVIEYWRS